jgi:hypothetical protein
MKKMKNLEWIQSRSSDAEKQLLEFMNELTAQSKEDVLTWLLSVSCDMNTNYDEELLTAQREIQHTEEILQLATWNQRKPQMMKPFPNDSVLQEADECRTFQEDSYPLICPVLLR